MPSQKLKAATYTSWRITVPKKMDASNTCHGNGIDSRGINLEIFIRDTYSGNSLIKNNLH
jgi:hypothetical protein